MTVAELFVRCLEAEGVRWIFGVPGEENEAVLFALEDSSIDFVPCRHEQGAAFIANVWGRLTGRAGVCLSTLGPGATNLVTGIADAHLDKAPVVALTAQGALDRLHHESHQYLDVVEMFRPITKWNATVTSPAIVAETVRKAFKLAELEKPGVTHIELPEDVASAEIDEGTRSMPIEPRTVRRAAPDPKALDQAVELLRGAKRPLVLAGNGAIRKLASKHLRRLVEAHRIPVAHTFMGKGAVSDRSEQSLWAVGLGFRDYVMEAFERADLVLAVGYDIAEYAPEEWNPGCDQRIVHIDFEPAEVYDHYHPEVELVCDVSGALWHLGERLADLPADGLSTHDGPTFDDPSWYADVRRRLVEHVESYSLEDGPTFTIPGVLSALRDELADDGLLISDVGSHKMWIARNFPTYEAGGCLISNGLASMGIALPGGIAASLVDPDRQIVSLMGDGGFLMNVQEMETAVRLGVGYTVIVVRDDDYGLISWKQERHRGRSVSTRIDNPDLVALGRSFGFESRRPTTADELRATLREAIPSRDPWLIDVPVDPSVNQELVDHLRAHVGTG